MVKKVKITEVIPNDKNPRYIKDKEFDKLVKSVSDFPEMLKLRPIVVNSENVILGGNMRYRASIKAGLKEVYIIQANDLSEKQEKEFIIKDNISFGAWDWDILANDWEENDLNDFGLFTKLEDNFSEEFFEDEKETEDNTLITITLKMDKRIYSQLENDIEKIINHHKSIVCKMED